MFPAHLPAHLKAKNQPQCSHSRCRCYRINCFFAFTFEFLSTFLLIFYCHSDSQPTVLISKCPSSSFPCVLVPALTQSAALKEGLADPNRTSSQRPQPQGCLDSVVHCHTSAAGHNSRIYSVLQNQSCRSE